MYQHLPRLGPYSQDHRKDYRLVAGLHWPKDHVDWLRQCLSSNSLGEDQLDWTPFTGLNYRTYFAVKNLFIYSLSDFASDYLRFQDFIRIYWPVHRISELCAWLNPRRQSTLCIKSRQFLDARITSRSILDDGSRHSLTVQHKINSSTSCVSTSFDIDFKIISQNENQTIW